MDIDDSTWKVQFEIRKGYLDSFINAVSALRTEGQLIATENAVFCDIVDPTNVAMAKSKVEGHALNSYKTRIEDQFIVGVNFEKWEDRLTNISVNSNIIVKYPVSKSGSHMMNLDVIEEDLTMNLPLVDKDSVPQAPQKDPISSDTRIKIDGSSFKSAITHCEKVETDQNKALEISTDGSVFRISSEDQVQGSISKEFRGSASNEDQEVEEKSTSIGMGYMKDVKGVVSGAEEVTMHIDNDYPVRLDCNIDDEGDAKIIYVIAPRVDT